MAAIASRQPVQPRPASSGGGRPAGAPAGFDVRDIVEGTALLASTANVIMQLARPAVGYGVVESKVEEGQVMRHPLRRFRTTITYLSVAFLGTADERRVYRRLVNRSHAHVRSDANSPVRYDAFDQPSPAQPGHAVPVQRLSAGSADTQARRDRGRRPVRPSPKGHASPRRMPDRADAERDRQHRQRDPGDE